MRACQACSREFASQRADCPWCGFNNAPKGGPRSKRMLEEIERRRREQEQFESELAELTDEFAAWLCWSEAADQQHEERTPA